MIAAIRGKLYHVQVRLRRHALQTCRGVVKPRYWFARKMHHIDASARAIVAVQRAPKVHEDVANKPCPTLRACVMGA